MTDLIYAIVIRPHLYFLTRNSDGKYYFSCLLPNMVNDYVLYGADSIDDCVKLAEADGHTVLNADSYSSMIGVISKP